MVCWSWLVHPSQGPQTCWICSSWFSGIMLGAWNWPWREYSTPLKWANLTNQSFHPLPQRGGLPWSIGTSWCSLMSIWHEKCKQAGKGSRTERKEKEKERDRGKGKRSEETFVKWHSLINIFLNWSRWIRCGQLQGQRKMEDTQSQRNPKRLLLAVIPGGPGGSWLWWQPTCLQAGVHTPHPTLETNVKGLHNCRNRAEEANCAWFLSSPRP